MFRLDSDKANGKAANPVKSCGSTSICLRYICNDLKPDCKSMLCYYRAFVVVMYSAIEGLEEEGRGRKNTTRRRGGW